MKKFYTILASLLMVGATAMAQAPLARAAKGQRAPMSSEKRAEMKAKAPARIHGGTNGDKPLYGVLSNWNGGNYWGFGNGIYAIDASGNHQLKWSVPESATSTYITKDGFGYALVMTTSSSEVRYSFYDFRTGGYAGSTGFTGNAQSAMALDLGFDPETSRAYGYFINSDYSNMETGQLGYFDVNALNMMDPITLVGDIAEPMRAMSCDADGQLWGIGFNKKLYKINKLNAEIEEVATITLAGFPWGATIDYGSTGALYGYESMEFDWETGDLYFSTVYNDWWDTAIAKIDTTTGVATCLVDLGYEGTEGVESFSGIFFEQSLKKTTVVPGTVTGLKVSPVGTELKAKVEFVLPTADTNGDALNGIVEWAITDGTNTLAEGSSMAGTPVVEEVAVAEQGFANFAVIASQNGVTSAPVSQRIYVGCDVPELWGVPDVFVDGNEATIMWEEAFAKNLGNLGDVTYRVVRQPEGAVVAEVTGETTATDKLDNNYKVRCTYEVTALAGGHESNTITSRATYVGEVFELPFNDGFTDEALFNQYPAIDNNNDGNTWYYDKSYKAATYVGGSVKADDYLCVGPFEFEAGSTYTLNLVAQATRGLEYFDVYVGTDPYDVATFSTEIIPEVKVNPTVGDAVESAEFEPTTSGKYYFGIRTTSGINSNGLHITSLKVSGITGDMPAVPALSSTPMETGVQLDITLPEKNHAGTGAANVTSVILYRDGEQIAEITEGVADGATVHYVDNPKNYIITPYVYSAVAVNAYGQSKTVTHQAYVGLDQPSAPRSMRIWEDRDKPGLIHITWEPPTEGVNGGYINPDDVTYNVDYTTYTSMGSDVKYVGKDLSYDLQLPEDELNVQDMVVVSIKATNAAGSSGTRSSETHSAYYGPAKTLPLSESWSGWSSSTGIWSGELITYNPEPFESCCFPVSGNSQDNDDAYEGFSTTIPGGGYRMRSPRITLDGTNNPVLAFYYTYTAGTKDFYVELALEDQPYKKIQDLNVDPEGADEWHLVEISLSDYKDYRYMQLGFCAHSEEPAENFAGFDNLNLFDSADYELSAVGITAPNKATYGEKISFVVEVRNSGRKDVNSGDYTVSLFKNGTEVQTVNGYGAESFSNGYAFLNDVVLPTDPEVNVYKAVINFDKDLNPDNNTTQEVSVIVVPSVYPTAENLTSENSDHVTLKWDAPDMNKIPGVSTTDSFEAYDAFMIEGFGDWKTIDRDGEPNVRVSSQFGTVNYPHMGEAAAWQVFNPSQVGAVLMGIWFAHEGDQMLVSFQASGAQSDDWLISPELDGSAQTLVFYANAGSYAMPEMIDIYVSTTGSEIGDFELYSSNIEVTYGDWKEYNVSIPAGTKYVAIVHTTVGGAALLMDDITFIPAGSQPMDLTLTGYNIYRDGVKIATVGADTTTYDDEEVVSGQKYTYCVTAIWDKGESPLSDPLTVNYVNGIEAINAGGQITVATEGLTIRVSGANGLPVAVYATSGATVATATGTDVTELTVGAAGVYVVRAGQHVSKVVVR